MVGELDKGFEIKLTILDQCIDGNIVELEKQWISKIGNGKNLLNTVSNEKNSTAHLHQEIKRLKSVIHEDSRLINELTGVKRARGIINDIHLLDNTRKLNKELNDKVRLLEDYIQNALHQPLPYEVKTRGKKRKSKKISITE
jgi:flagellar basal body-associated protein FliL